MRIDDLKQLWRYYLCCVRISKWYACFISLGQEIQSFAYSFKSMRNCYVSSVHKSDIRNSVMEISECIIKSHFDRNIYQIASCDIPLNYNTWLIGACMHDGQTHDDRWSKTIIITEILFVLRAYITVICLLHFTRTGNPIICPIASNPGIFSKIIINCVLGSQIGYNSV